VVDGATRPRVPAGADSTPAAARATEGRRPSAVAVVIAACAALALLLRAYQLSRPGYLLGVTEYDDGAMFGDTLQFVSGVIPYRDFQMVQPPGIMLIMAPAALLAKVIGAAPGLAVARVLTVGADTVNVILLGLLVRHRGALTAGIACGLYAVYPDALVASHTMLLEPWLNLCCLLAALALFDGDRLVGTGTRVAPDTARAPRLSDTARLAWAGVAFGFGADVKIWALAPLGVAGLLLLIGPVSAGTGPIPAARRPASVLRLAAARLRPAATLAGGAVLGLGVPLLPFAVLALAGLARGVLIGQLARNSGGHRDPLARLVDMAGLRLLPGGLPERTLLVVIVLVLAGCYAWAHLAAGRHSAWLDAYAAIAAIVVTVMFLWPRLYYTHYGAFAGPFLALAIALPIGLLARGRSAAGNSGQAGDSTAARVRRPVHPLTASLAMVLAAGLVWSTYSSLRTESRERGTEVAAAADRLIPAGACVVTNGASYTVAANRFFSTDPDCPPMVDAFGTLFAMTSGGNQASPPNVLRPVVELWQTTLEHAQYVWLTSTTVAQIPWNSQLYGYFHTHFRLIGLKGSPTPARYPYVPRPGLYART
jgi:alpha-1,2-mannosyltransferase